MPDILPPVDTNVAIPDSVKRAAAAADALHQQAYQTQPEPGPQGEVQPQPEPGPQGEVQPQPEPGPQGEVQPQPEPQPQPQRQPKPRPAPVPETGDTGSWENRFHSMKGRFDQSQQTLGGIQEQLTEMGDELMRTQQALALARRGNPEARPLTALPSITKNVRSEDVETYGPELLEFVTRAARDAVAPDLQQVTQQVRQTSQRVTQTAQTGLFAALEDAIPNWREINVDPRFKVWCTLRDVYSGAVRGKLLNDAFHAADAPRVAAFFQGFLDEEQATGQLSAPQPEPQAQPVPRQAAVPLTSLAAPGRAKPASGDTAATAADKPVFTHGQISKFYSDVRKGLYAGRDADKARDEAAIFAAQKDGRIR